MTPTEQQLSALSHRDQVLFAYKCVSLIKSQACPDGLAALEVVEGWLDGKATAEECKDAWTAVCTTWAAQEAKYATAWAAWVAWAVDATWAAAGTAARVAQYTAKADPTTVDTIWLYYRELADPVGTLVEGLGLGS